MDKTVTQDKTTRPDNSLEHYEVAATQLYQLKNARAYDRITIHDVNNSLGKINNALWLMAREPDNSTPLFRTCQQIVENELANSRRMLSESTTTTS